MKLSDELELAIERVKKMEQYLDEVTFVIHHDRQFLLDDTELREKIEILSDYYSNGTWLSDYDRDSRGEFPTELKRGVLSQDMLYDLFEKIKKEKETK